MTLPRPHTTQLLRAPRSDRTSTPKICRETCIVVVWLLIIPLTQQQSRAHAYSSTSGERRSGAPAVAWGFLSLGWLLFKIFQNAQRRWLFSHTAQWEGLPIVYLKSPAGL